MAEAENPRAVINANIRAILKALVERIEKLDEEKKALSDDIRDVYSEAKAGGFDTKALRRIIALRKMDPTEREELDALVDMYCKALGMGVFE